MINKEELIGKTLEEAKILLKDNIYRVVYFNGKHCGITCDFIPFRYNLSIENNLINDITFG